MGRRGRGTQRATCCTLLLPCARLCCLQGRPLPPQLLHHLGQGLYWCGWQVSNESFSPGRKKALQIERRAPQG
jgi:hypothetical protein